MGYEVYTYPHEYEKVIYDTVTDFDGSHAFCMWAGG